MEHRGRVCAGGRGEENEVLRENINDFKNHSKNKS